MTLSSPSDTVISLTPERVKITYCSVRQKGKYLSPERKFLSKIFHIKNNNNANFNTHYSFFYFLLIGHSRTVKYSTSISDETDSTIFHFSSLFTPACHPVSLSLRTWKQFKSLQLQWLRRSVYSDRKYAYNYNNIITLILWLLLLISKLLTCNPNWEQTARLVWLFLLTQTDSLKWMKPVGQSIWTEQSVMSLSHGVNHQTTSSVLFIYSLNLCIMYDSEWVKNHYCDLSAFYWLVFNLTTKQSKYSMF